MKIIPSIILLATLLSFPLVASAQEFGLVSYFSDDYHGRKTAYGDVYDMNKMTCAHKKHPYGTMLRITRRDNKKSVVCKVTDQGPYIKGRIIEVSKAAAVALDLIKDGVAEVEVVVVQEGDADKPTISEAIPEKKEPEKPKTETRPREFEETSSKEEAEKTTPPPAAPTKTVAETRPTTPPAAREETRTAINRANLVGQDYTKYGLYKIQLERTGRTGFGVQVASLTNYENVLQQVADLQAKGFVNILISVEKGVDKPYYKIMLGPFPTEPGAEELKRNLKRKYKMDSFVVDFSKLSY